MLKVNNFSIKFVLKLKVIQQLTSYLKFLILSTNQHGVHSPFVYNLVTKCFYTKTDKQKHLKFITYRNFLLKNKTKIVVTDFGAGSKVFKSNLRKIQTITKKVGIETKRADLLIRFVEYFNPLTILELGTSVGLSTYCLQLGNLAAKITTLEGCPNTAQIAKNTLNSFLVFPQIIIENFDNSLPLVLKDNTFDMIFIDGNHQKAATLSYFNQVLNAIHNDSILIFDDIHWSKDMENAWEYIKNHPKVTVSIDTYQWGIVFFRKEQAKEHFIIRI